MTSFFRTTFKIYIMYPDICTKAKKIWAVWQERHLWCLRIFKITTSNAIPLVQKPHLVIAHDVDRIFLGAHSGQGVHFPKHVLPISLTLEAAAGALDGVAASVQSTLYLSQEKKPQQSTVSNDRQRAKKHQAEMVCVNSLHCPFNTGC